jgi:hypothetical protein
MKMTLTIIQSTFGVKFISFPYTCTYFSCVVYKVDISYHFVYM